MEFAEQIKKVKEMKLPVAKGFDKIVICGMGGSGASGHVLKDLYDDKPVFVFQGYNIGKFVDKKTLVFCISYSGNTAETLNMYNQAKKKTKKIVVIASGGKLGKEKGAVLIPSGLQPRQALGYLFFPMWKILGKSFGEVEEIVGNVEGDLGIAAKLNGKLPVIYTNEGFSCVSLRWKQQLNEDSKVLAVANVFPELNHNEIEAKYDNAQIVFLKDKEELAIEILKKEIDILEIELKGKTKLEKTFYGLALANIVSVELSKLNGENYMEYRFIEKLKEEMKKAKKK